MAKKVVVTVGREEVEVSFEDHDGRLRKRPPWYGWLIERLSWFVTGLAFWQALRSGGLV